MLWFFQSHNPEHKEIKRSISSWCLLLSACLLNNNYVCVSLRVCALPPLVSGCQVVTLLHQDVESTSFVAVADVQQDLAAHLGVTIVTGLTVHTHHAVYATLLNKDTRKGEHQEKTTTRVIHQKRRGGK